MHLKQIKIIKEIQLYNAAVKNRNNSTKVYIQQTTAKSQNVCRRRNTDTSAVLPPVMQHLLHRLGALIVSAE